MTRHTFSGAHISREISDERQASKEGNAPAEISVKRCKATKTHERVVIGVTEAPTCSEIDIAGYLLAPFQDRGEIGDTQTQWAHLGVIRHRIYTAELLILQWLHRWRDDNSFRLNAHIGRKYVSFQGLL